MPQDLTSLIDSDFETIEPVLETVPALANPENRRVTALLKDRTIRLLRTGARTAILDEALGLRRFLHSAKGQQLQENVPLLFGGWTAFADLLSESARRSDAAAAESILKSHPTYGRRVLELLAEQDEAIPRSTIRRRLEIAESHLSRMLRDLEEANLIVRYRPDKGREVLVELGAIGKDCVERSILPSWIRLASQILEQKEPAQRFPSEANLTEMFKKNGCPSDLAARELAQLVARAAGWESKRWGMECNQRESSENPHFSQIRQQQGQRPPRALFLVA